MKHLKEQLEKLNEKIDNKILSGKSYRKESEEHRNLIAFIKDNE